MKIPWSFLWSIWLLFSSFPLNGQISGSNAKAAFIYQDTVPSGFAQVLTYDAGTNSSGSPGNPPTTTYGIGAKSGTINPIVTAPPGQIIRWQLWAERSNPAQWYQLDVKALLPIQESLILASLDSINPQRTRVGKTYHISINISGMPTDDSGATESGQVYLGLSALVDGTTFGFRSLANYSSTPSPSINDPANPGSLQAYQYNAWFLDDGAYQINNLAPAQPGTDLWLIDWIETTQWSSSQIDQGSMLVLPSPSASSNLPFHTLYNGDPGSLPSLDLNFSNLYPGSLTILQILDANQNVLATLTVNDDTQNGTQNSSHTVGHFPVDLTQYITQEGNYSFQAWTAEPFSDGLDTANGLLPPPTYTWSPLPLPNLSSLQVQFTAKVIGTIITN